MKRNKIEQALFLQGITVEEFKELISESLNHRFDLSQAKLSLDDKISSVGIEIDYKNPYLTRSEVSKRLQISLPTLHNYVKQGLIKSYRIGGKVRFKQQEIEESLTERNFTSINRKGGKHGN